MSDFDLGLDDDAMEWYFGSCNLRRSQANVVELATLSQPLRLDEGQKA